MQNFLFDKVGFGYVIKVLEGLVAIFCKTTKSLNLPSNASLINFDFKIAQAKAPWNLAAGQA